MKDMSLEEKVVKYILTRQNDLSPFRLSRILILSELEYVKKHGKKPLEFYYVIYPSAFYIEGFSEFLQDIEDLEKVIEEKDSKKRGYFHLKKPCSCEIPEDLKEIIDNILTTTKDLSDEDLNRMVVEREDYRSYIQN